MSNLKECVQFLLEERIQEYHRRLKPNYKDDVWYGKDLNMSLAEAERLWAKLTEYNKPKVKNYAYTPIGTAYSYT